jgi:hypothetical protein
VEWFAAAHLIPSPILHVRTKDRFHVGYDGYVIWEYRTRDHADHAGPEIIETVSALLALNPPQSAEG